MHSAKLNLLAVIVNANLDLFQRIPLERMGWLAQQHWTLSRHRLDGWNQSLAQLEHRLREGDTWQATLGPLGEAVIEEVLLSQLFSRMWGAWLLHYDTQRRPSAADALAGLAVNLAQSHRETANRAMWLLGSARDHAWPRAELLNRLRRRIERWTDMLLVPLASNIDLTPLCFDLNRVRDLLEVNAQNVDRPTVSMWYGGLQAAQLEAGQQAASPIWNRHLASMTLSCLPALAWSEVDLHLDLSILRSDQFTWEIDCLLTEALYSDLNPHSQTAS